MHDSQLHHELAARGVSDLHAAGHFLHFNAKGRRMRRRTLNLLNERGPLPQKEVQDILQIKSGSVSEMLGKMEKKGCSNAFATNTTGAVPFFRSHRRDRRKPRSCRRFTKRGCPG
ncbi:MAG: winged helix-turn-helix transcriptional regulator [Clostridia bacterium]|nr:winged helix-turn-helix transcriptional regulator [Clostridia bacterium]